MQIVPKKPKRKDRSRKNRAPSIRSGLGATRERARQCGGIIKEYAPSDRIKGQPVERHRAVYECKLDAYLAHKKIDDVQFRAGMRFREAWLFMAQGVQTVDSSTMERVDNAPYMSPEEREKKKRGAELTLHQAYKEAGLTVGQSLVIQRVCGVDESIGDGGDVKTLCRGLEKLAVLWDIRPS